MHAQLGPTHTIDCPDSGHLTQVLSGSDTRPFPSVEGAGTPITSLSAKVEGGVMLTEISIQIASPEC